jgi:hypothetical protein
MSASVVFHKNIVSSLDASLDTMEINVVEKITRNKSAEW